VQVQKSKQGYKRVKSIFGKEIEIPEDWKFQKIRENCEKLVVGFVGTCEPFYTDNDDGVPMLRTTNVSEGELDLNNLKYVTREFHSKNKKSQVHQNDLLVSRHGENGESCLVRNLKEANCLNIVIIRCKKNMFIPDFFELIFNSNIVRKQIRRTTAGGVQGVVNTGEIAKVKIIIPSINEQQKIASILSNMGLLISSYDGMIQATKKLKQGLIQQLLTKGIGHKKFKKVQWVYRKEIKIPEDWEIKNLEQISEKLVSGGTPSTKISNYWNGEIPWTRSAVLTKMYADNGEQMISHKGLKNSSATIIPKGNLLVASRVSLGNLSINIIDIAINQDVTGILVDKSKTLTEFLYWFLNQNIKIPISYSQGMTIKGFTRKELSKLLILIPKLEEQKRIASILTEMNSKIIDLQSKTTHLKKIKKGLMQKLLTGQIRV
jgi:type I restriction enzyme, S subunit